ncbi:aminomethyl-transferring glycine dehydrogenase subunit GcvPA [bacterium]
MSYIPHTDDDIKDIKNQLNIKEISELLKNIPANLRLKKDLNLPKGLSELELKKHIRNVQALNNYDNYISFLGAGMYDHYIPAATKNLSSRSEFLTAYTPYQAEISQGLLQAIFEYQTCIANLTGMEMANASLYDGATSLFEAAKLAINYTKRRKIIISNLVHPEYIEVLKTSFSSSNDIEIVCIPHKNGALDLEYLKNICDESVCAVIVSQPNFFGMIEDLEAVSNIAKTNGALFIVSVYPTALGVLEKPGKLGADIVVGEGQSLGLPMALGGATLGIFAAKKKYIRLVPGRIVGLTSDDEGNKGFVLTLQAREQHIRRSRALSNICSNHANCALQALIYLSCMGEKGLERVANISLANAYYFAGKLDEINGFEVVYKRGFFNEFVVRLDENLNFDKINKRLNDQGIILGLELGKYFDDMKNCWLVCVTETKSREELDRVDRIITNLKIVSF